ncbi:hypothetical protein T484DRAFT_1784013, partial [Baffinella frigidus]
MQQGRTVELQEAGVGGGSTVSAVTVDYPERAPDQLTRTELVDVSRSTTARSQSASSAGGRPHARAPRPFSAQNRLLNSPPVLTPIPREPFTASDTVAKSAVPSFPNIADDPRTSKKGTFTTFWGGAEIAEAGGETARSGATTSRDSRAHISELAAPDAATPGWTTARSATSSRNSPPPPRKGVAAGRKLWAPGAKPAGPPQRPPGPQKASTARAGGAEHGRSGSAEAPPGRAASGGAAGGGARGTGPGGMRAKRGATAQPLAGRGRVGTADEDSDILEALLNPPPARPPTAPGRIRAGGAKGGGRWGGFRLIGPGEEAPSPTSSRSPSKSSYSPSKSSHSPSYSPSKSSHFEGGDHFQSGSFQSGHFQNDALQKSLLHPSPGRARSREGHSEAGTRARVRGVDRPNRFQPLPPHWTPVPGERGEQDDAFDARATVAWAAKFTGIRPAKFFEQRPRTGGAARHGPGDMLFNNMGGQQAWKKRELANKKGKGKGEEAETMVGKDVPVDQLPQGDTRVRYSEEFFEVKKLTPEDVADLGIGTIVGWDADGLMTNVRWQDGSVEYCCTGFGGRFFLVLHKEGGDTKKNKDADPVVTEALSYPPFEVDEEGLSRIPLNLRTNKGANMDVVDAQKLEVLDVLHADRRILGARLDLQVGEEKISLAPSALAPPASDSKLSLLDE